MVDDDVDIRDTIAEALVDRGYEAIAVKNGDEALRLLESERADPPCVIFLDMMMPVMSGAELLEELATKEEALRAIPVVVVSAHVESVEGVADVLKKPFSVERLEQLAARYC